MQDLVGKQIDRYRVTESLGVGGMAVVYKAYDTRLERNVAIKLIRTESIPQDQHARLLKRFEREAKSQARFDHKHIVHVYDYGEVNGAPYLVMAYIPGGTLKLRTGQPIPYQQAIRWLLPVADALDYAHKRGVVHRDIKPSNILFNDEDQPILTDFGIAKLLETDDATLTGTGLGVGTPEYMAPEQWRGQASPATDQYALGVVLYELLTGEKPYKADTPAAVAIQQATEPLRSPRALAPDIPEGVEKLLYKALARSPQDRYADMTAFRAALEKQLPWRAAEAGKPREVVRIPTSHQVKPSLPGIGSQAETVDALEPTPADLPRLNATRQAGTHHVNEKQKRTGFPTWALWSMGAALLVIGLVVGIGFLNRDRGGTPANVAEPTEAALALVDTLLPTITDTSVPTVTETPFPSPTATETPLPSPTVEATLGIGSTMANPVDGAEMVFVPEGRFRMGSSDMDDRSWEKPMHIVNLDAFWIYKTEVTNDQFSLFVMDTSYITEAERREWNLVWDGNSWQNKSGVYWAAPEGLGSNIESRGNHPAVHVTWDDAHAYCEWAGGRLPTEAEWEKAARGPGLNIYPWGDQIPTCGLANYAGCMGGTAPVGSHPRDISTYGVLDMGGNVSEWVSDWFDENYYEQSPLNNPTGPENGSERVYRGGSWYFHESVMRVWIRLGSAPDYSTNEIGFRCAYSAAP